MFAIGTVNTGETVAPLENPTPIKKYLESLGAFVVNLHGGSYLIGLPDLIGCLDGRFVAVEVKRPGGKATKLQRKVREKITRAGGISIIASSVSEVVTVVESLEPLPHHSQHVT